MYFLYSFSVVAPMARNSPRASAGFSMLEASIAPSAAPAPTSVCNSSMNRIICPSASETSFSTAFRRSSNSPRNFAPATSAAKSSATIFFVFNTSGTSPDTIRCASPSTIAVFPTPGSPISTGLFFVRRANICITRRISSSRPITGSSFDRRATSFISNSLRMPSRASKGGTTPSFCSTSATNRCNGSIAWFSCRAAIPCDSCTASWAFTVILSKRNINSSQTRFFKKRGWLPSQPRMLTHGAIRRAGTFANYLPAADAAGAFTFTLICFIRFFPLRNRQRQHPVLILGLDRLAVHGVCQREGPAERAIRTLHPQIVVLIHLLLKLPLTANRQDVVLHTNVQLLRFDVRKIGLDHQFVLSLLHELSKR